MWTWIQNNLGIIIIALSFGVSGIGWLLQQLKEARDKKQAEEARKRARLEALRTGRVESPVAGQPGSRPGSPMPTSGRPSQAETPRQRLEELAKRRQREQAQRTATQRQELEEQLRRRREAIDAQRRQQQQARGRPPQPASRQTSPQQAGPRGARQQQAPQPPRQRPAQRAPQPARQPARQPGEQRRPTPTPPVPPTEVPVQETSIGDMIERDRIQRQQVSATFPAPGVRSTSARLARGFDLRQAVIMREIFEKPIGMRPPQDESF